MVFEVFEEDDFLCDCEVEVYGYYGMEFVCCFGLEISDDDDIVIVYFGCGVVSEFDIVEVDVVDDFEFDVDEVG